MFKALKDDITHPNKQNSSSNAWLELKMKCDDYFKYWSMQMLKLKLYCKLSGDKLH